MASSRVMSSTSPANPDLPRHSTTTSSSNSLTPHSTSSSAAADVPLLHRHNHLHHHHHQPSPPFQTHHLNHHSDHAIVSPFGSLNMEEILKNMYSEPDSLAGAESAMGAGGSVGKNEPDVGGKTVDEVWKDIVTGGEGAGSKEPRMTLEDFLTKAGAVSEEDVRGAPPQVPAGYSMETMMNAAAAAGVQFPAAPMPVVHMQNGPGSFGMETHLGFGNGLVPAPAAGSVRAGSGNGGGGGRGKRRAPPVEEVALDKASQQKQRRMIKNRESAARSRERKQAYTVELESLVTQLEEENARLLRAEAEQNKQRFKQLMENLIPVVEKRRPPRVLRRVQSMSW